MKPILALLSTAGCVALGVTALVTMTERAFADPAHSAAAERIERGRYLVHQVGMCIDCHSPRDDKGAFVAAKHLTGAPLPFAATVPMPWNPVAPNIAGLPAGFTAEQTVHFLMTGERPNGRPAPLPPMPAFRFNRSDAEAVTAFLQSLPSPATTAATN